MEWHDDAIVLSLRRHGETASILEALTRDHGRHLGLVHGGGASSKVRATVQPGNRIRVGWRARLPDHLGTFSAELIRGRAAAMFDTAGGLAGLNALNAIAAAVLPEREPHHGAFEGADAVLETMAEHALVDWLPLYVRWELGLLDELGFGLDLSACAVTGTLNDLRYVSPKSGRAVSGAAAGAYRGRLLPLPSFLVGLQSGPVRTTDMVEGLRLTAHFLEHRVLMPHGKALPAARQRLQDVAGRATSSLPPEV